MAEADPIWPAGTGEMAGRIRAHDWSRTSLGPVEGWPERLRLMVEQVLANPIVATLVCGFERLLIYNDAAVRLYGDKHPDALGRLLPETFPAGWTTVAPLYARAFGGESVHVTAQALDTRGEGNSAADVFDAILVPVRETNGQVAYVQMIGLEMGERVRAEARLRLVEERNRQFSDATPDIIWGRNADTLQLDFLNPAFGEIFGINQAEILLGNDLRRWLEFILPNDRHEALRSLQRVREGERTSFEYRIRRPVDGAVRWVRDTGFAIRDAAGKISRLGGIGQDITDLKTIAAALSHSEQRLRTLVEGVPQLVWRAIDGGDWTWASPQWTAFTGQAEADSHHLGWLEPIHPDDRETARAAWDDALQTGGFEVEYRIWNAGPGMYCWFQTRATPVRDEAGTIVEWLGTSTDIHDLRELQDRQKVPVAELQHRTRNLMGVVRAMAESTLRSSTDLDAFAARFRDRLDALSRVQGLLSRLNEGDRVTFNDLIRNELTALGAINGTMGNVTMDGPTGVALRSTTVQTFALALHELATNAIKYGALGQPSARLAITWRLEPARSDGRRWLHVDWHESGVAMPATDAAAQGTGQGRRLIERALPYQLGARTTYVMGPDGVRCSIAVPVSNRTATEEPADDVPPASQPTHTRG